MSKISADVTLPQNREGSYDFVSCTDMRSEYSRLERQAISLWDVDSAILRRAGVVSGARVLDLGCGPGFLSRGIAGLVGNGWVLGIDQNENFIEMANDLKSRAGLGEAVDFRVGNAYDLEEWTGTFDVVVARFVAQHLTDPASALAWIRRALVPGGRVALIDADDSLLTVLPERPDLSSLVRESMEHQAALGGDRAIGRKLGRLLRLAGFRDVRQAIDVVDAAEIGVPAFLELAYGYRWKFFPENEREAARDRLEYALVRAADEIEDAHCGLYSAVGVN